MVFGPGAGVELIEIRLLGRFSVRRHGEEVLPGTLGHRLGRTLLRILVTRRGTFMTQDALAEALWAGVRPPLDPGANIKVLVARIRRGLADPSLIVTGTQGYAFAPAGACVVDTEAFLVRLEAGRAHLSARRLADALAELQAGFALWAGDPLAEDTYSEWAQAYRRRLSRAHVEALELAASAALETGAAHRAVTFAEAATDEEPLRETANLLLVRALEASGDAVAALRAYDAFRLRLADELGLDPSAEGEALQARLLRRGLGSGAAPARPSVPQRSDPVVAELPFAGRDDELAAALAALFGPRSGIVLVSGTAGAGKSRFVAEVVARSGQPAASARAYLPEQQEEWALARSLLHDVLGLVADAAAGLPDRAALVLAEIVPELGIGGPAEPVAPESRRALAFEAAIRMLGAAASAGTLLAADDLQWADATTLSILGRAATRIPGLGMILAFRPEDVPPGSPCAAFFEQVRVLERPTVSLSLGRLPAEALGRLVADKALAGVLEHETDGTPLAVAEVLRALASARVVAPGPAGIWRTTNPQAVELARAAAAAGQRRAIRSRVDRRHGPERDLLDLLCLLGREAPARVLTAVTSRPQGAVLDDLDALARAGLVRIAETGWIAAHDVIAECVRDSLSAPARARLHALLAEGLRVAGAAPAELARHLAGAGDAVAAAGAYARAARDSLERYAGDEAERLAQAGLDLGPHPEARAALLDVRAEARSRRGDLAGARADLAEALPATPGGAARSRTLSKMAMLASGFDDLAHADALVPLAVTEAGDDPDARAEALFVGAVVDMNLNRMDRAGIRFDEALALFDQAGNARGMAGILDGRAMRLWLEGWIREAADAFGRVANLFGTTGDLLRVVMPRAGRGACLAQMGRPAEGLADVDAALELARLLGDLEGEGRGLMFRAQVLAALGRTGEAVACGDQSLSIAERLGHREWKAAALWALGSAHDAAGDYRAAEHAYRRSLHVAGDRLPFWAGRAAARLASMRILAGDLVEAQALVDRALAAGLPLSLFEARLARAQLALARREPGAEGLAADAVALAEERGYLVGAVRFRRITGAAVGKGADSV
jgi:DNA-binding SARP family transcriptional activator/tetratricopeptide (TPR) repeat protein